MATPVIAEPVNVTALLVQQQTVGHAMYYVYYETTRPQKQLHDRINRHNCEKKLVQRPLHTNAKCSCWGRFVPTGQV